MEQTSINTISDKVLNSLKKTKWVESIKRHNFIEYDLNVQMDMIIKIGKLRDPDFVINDYNRLFYQNMVKWVWNDPTLVHLVNKEKITPKNGLKCGFYISGETGCGKSFGLELLFNYCKILGMPVEVGEEKYFFSPSNIFKAQDICDGYIAEGNIEKFKSIKILGIQDLGSETPESIYMGNRKNVLQSLLEYRGERQNCLTFITSNFAINSEKIRTLYGDRVASRLPHMCNYYEIFGGSRRRKID